MSSRRRALRKSGWLGQRPSYFALGRRFALPQPPAATHRPARNPACGFTLLEIILSLAILAGALAALGEVMRSADQNAALTRDETQAQIAAASIMDELVAGARVLSGVNGDVFDPLADPPLLYSISFENTAYEALVAVRVVVEQQAEPGAPPARYELVRWIANPDYVPTTGGDEAANSQATDQSQGGQQ